MLKLQAKGVAIWTDEHHWTVHCVRSSEWSTFHLQLCISYQCIWGWQHLQKPSPKCHFTYIFCYFYFTLGLHPRLCWLLERSQILGCPRQLQTCARLMQGWVASAGCPPNKNPGYAGVCELRGSYPRSATSLLGLWFEPTAPTNDHCRHSRISQLLSDVPFDSVSK